MGHRPENWQFKHGTCCVLFFSFSEFEATSALAYCNAEAGHGDIINAPGNKELQW